MKRLSKCMAIVFYFVIPSGFIVLSILQPTFLQLYSGSAVLAFILYQGIFYKEIYRARVGAKYITKWNLRVVKNPNYEPRHAIAS